MDTTRHPGLHIEQVFVQKAHFEHRSDALALPANEPLDLKFRLAWRSGGNEDGDSALCQLRFVTSDDNDPLYHLDVVMTIVVSAVKGEENMDPLEYARHVAPAALTPYMREFVSDLTRRGRFGAVDFPPINLTLAEAEQEELELES